MRRVTKTEWTQSYLNALPDEAFAAIEPGGSLDADGRTTPRTLRHFAFKSADGKPAPARVREGLRRISQADLPKPLKERARRKLEAAAEAAKLKLEDVEPETKAEACAPKRTRKKFEVDPDRITALIGGDWDGYSVDEKAETVTVGAYTLPLAKVARTATATRGGVEYPAEAFAHVPDPGDPETWTLKLWETPAKGATLSQLHEALAELAVADISPEDLPEVVAKLRTAWRATVKNRTALPPALADRADRSVTSKSSFEETETGFRYKVRDATDFLPNSFRTVVVTAGLKSVMGKQTTKGALVLQSLFFDKAEFASQDDAAKWLQENPDVKKRADEVAALGNDALTMAARAWEDDVELDGQAFACISKAIPDDGVDRYTLEALVGPIPAEVAEQVESLDALTAEGWPVRFTLKLASQEKVQGWFGFELGGNPLGDARELLVALPDAGAEPLAEHSRLVSKTENDRTALIVLDSGLYEIEQAAPDRALVHFKSEQGEAGLNGGHLFSGSGDFWTVRCAEDSDGLNPERWNEVNERLKELYNGDAGWLMIPKSKRGGGSGLRIVDVTKTVAHSLNYKVLKAADSERRYTLGLAYPANRLDAHGEFATEDQLERTAWEYMASRRGIGLMHKNGTDGAGATVESYIYRGPVWKIASQTIRPGDWLIGVIWNEVAWELIKKGELTGFSIQGWSRRS